jgi:hypothetical protein
MVELHEVDDENQRSQDKVGTRARRGGKLMKNEAGKHLARLLQ